MCWNVLCQWQTTDNNSILRKFIRWIPTNSGHLPRQNQLIPSLLWVPSWLAHYSFTETLEYRGHYVTVYREYYPSLYRRCSLQIKLWFQLNDLLESCNIHICLCLPTLQTVCSHWILLVINLPKTFWDASLMNGILAGKSNEEIETFNLQPIDVSMVRMKEVSSDGWLFRPESIVSC